VAKRILIVEAKAEEAKARTWTAFLQQAGFEVAIGHIDALSLRPANADLLLMEAEVLERGGRELVETAVADDDRPRVLIVTATFTAERVLCLARHGDLTLPLPLDTSVLLAAVEHLLQRQDYVTQFARSYKLSPRESALLRLATAGRNNDEAAAQLGCTRATVATYWNRMFRKTGVSGQRDLMILLMRSKDGSGRFPKADVVTSAARSLRPKP
jgi:DNA-binding NarL/FixJ family response regulator